MIIYFYSSHSTQPITMSCWERHELENSPSVGPPEATVPCHSCPCHFLYTCKHVSPMEQGWFGWFNLFYKLEYKMGNTKSWGGLISSTQTMQPFKPPERLGSLYKWSAFPVTRESPTHRLKILSYPPDPPKKSKQNYQLPFPFETHELGHQILRDSNQSPQEQSPVGIGKLRTWNGFQGGSESAFKEMCVRQGEQGGGNVLVDRQPVHHSQEQAHRTTLHR